MPLLSLHQPGYMCQQWEKKKNRVKIFLSLSVSLIASCSCSCIAPAFFLFWKKKRQIWSSPRSFLSFFLFSVFDARTWECSTAVVKINDLPFLLLYFFSYFLVSLFLSLFCFVSFSFSLIVSITCFFFFSFASVTLYLFVSHTYFHLFLTSYLLSHYSLCVSVSFSINNQYKWYMWNEKQSKWLAPFFLSPLLFFSFLTNMRQVNHLHVNFMLTFHLTCNWWMKENNNKYKDTFNMMMMRLAFKSSLLSSQKIYFIFHSHSQQQVTFSVQLLSSWCLNYHHRDTCTDVDQVFARKSLRNTRIKLIPCEKSDATNRFTQVHCECHSLLRVSV